MAHLLQHKCYIHFVFSVKRRQKIQILVAAFFSSFFPDVHQQYLEFLLTRRTNLFSIKQLRLKIKMEDSEAHIMPFLRTVLD